MRRWTLVLEVSKSDKKQRPIPQWPSRRKHGGNQFVDVRFSERLPRSFHPQTLRRFVEIVFPRTSPRPPAFIAYDWHRIDLKWQRLLECFHIHRLSRLFEVYTCFESLTGFFLFFLYNGTGYGWLTFKDAIMDKSWYARFDIL